MRALRCAHAASVLRQQRREFPVYKCFQGGSRSSPLRCQEVRALDLDAEIERIALAALAPDKVAIALTTMAEVEREDAALQEAMALASRASSVRTRTRTSSIRHGRT